MPSKSASETKNTIEVVAAFALHIAETVSTTRLSKLAFPGWTESLWVPLSTHNPVSREWILPKLFDLLCGSSHRAHRAWPANNAESPRPTLAVDDSGVTHSVWALQLLAPEGNLSCPDGILTATFATGDTLDRDLWLLVHLTLFLDSEESCKESFRVLDELTGYSRAKQSDHPYLLEQIKNMMGVSQPAAIGTLVPNGCLLRATGDIFHAHRPDLTDFSTLTATGRLRAWSPEAEWLWWLSECVELRRRRDPPPTIEEEIFDFQGQPGYVGRNAIVLLDNPTTTEGSPSWPKPAAGLARSLQFDLHATNAFLLATFQRNHLYSLADYLIINGDQQTRRRDERMEREQAVKYRRRLFAFRQRYWWVHLDSNPSANVMRAYQDRHRLPELMDQLVNEARDYSDTAQSAATDRLNDVIKILTAMSVATGTLQVYFAFRADSSPIGATAIVSAFVFVLLLVLLVGTSWFRTRRSTQG